MGVLSNTKKYLARKAVSAAGKAADGLAAAATLSPKQVEEITKKRERYLSEIPSMDSDDVQAAIQRNLGAVAIEVYQAYLEQLKTVYCPMGVSMSGFDAINRIRYFDITRWVTDTEEKNLDKLVNVYQVLSGEDCNIALIYHRSVEKCGVTLGVVNTSEEQSDPSIVKTYYARLLNAIQGNFPGIEVRENVGNKDKFGLGIPTPLVDAIVPALEQPQAKSVAIVSNLASEKSEDFISQSMEKLLDGIVPQDASEEYTIVLLAKPVTNQLELKTRLFGLHSALAPYAAWQTNYTYTTADTIGNNSSFGINLGMSAGVSAGFSDTNGTNHAQLADKGSSGKKKVLKTAGGFLKHLVGLSTQESNSHAISGGSYAGANFGVNFSRASTVNVQIGLNEGVTQSFSNYGVKHTMDLIESQMKRIEEGSALGMWDVSSYILAASPVIANNVAHMYLALTQGDDSYMTRSAINLWDGERDRGEALAILESVQKLQHPVFALRPELSDEWMMYPTLVTPSATISGKELAKSLNFPRKSVNGFPVLETTAFGREVHRLDSVAVREKETVDIGSVYHMRKKDIPAVSLDVASLTSHTFITGSTGAGKTNTVYQILSKLQDQGVNFLVVEPAKGEYKNVLGAKAHVYGTNPQKTRLLCINPFSFPSDIHVLEHIDRLVEIFNACWPMYAAMPAVLKDAVEQCYVKAGWNLLNSKCCPLTFPTFSDLLATLPEILESSLYSGDTKSDYEGALVTRVRSLTNGVNGQLFCSSNELSNEDLFESNVIVDLSRIGSSETKALMMGIIVMKLQEYRMHLDRMTSKLTHVTVLEEAHNLLRRTSTTQSQESSNLQGKAVEMLSNSIAEMRAYGEGFIIADQAPALLDEAAIRNTNTKIVFRLPDGADRELIGASMALTDAQAVELARLPKGVAAVYQNDWVEAVLCQFDKFNGGKPFSYTWKDDSKTFERFFKSIFISTGGHKLKEEDVDTITNWIRGLRKSEVTRQLLLDSLDGKALSQNGKEALAYNLFNGRSIAALLAAEPEKSREKALKKVDNSIKVTYGLQDPDLVETIRQAILSAIFRMNQDGELARRYQSIEKMRGHGI